MYPLYTPIYRTYQHEQFITKELLILMEQALKYQSQISIIILFLTTPMNVNQNCK